MRKANIPIDAGDDAIGAALQIFIQHFYGGRQRLRQSQAGFAHSAQIPVSKRFIRITLKHEAPPK